MNNRLAGQFCYLAGFIDGNPKEARGWRNDMKKFLNELEIGVYDPCDKPILNSKISEDEDFVAKINQMKEDKAYVLVQQQMQEVVRIDLHMVDLSSFLILNINRDYHMCGSYSEFTYACLERKPVFVYCEQGVSQIPNWIWGLGDWFMFHDNWNTLKSQIREIAYSDNQWDLNGKFRWIDYNKVFGRTSST